MTKILLAIGLLLSSSVSMAKVRGGVDGGGGKSVVCRDRKGAITSAETLDLFEGKNLYTLKMTQFQGTTDDILAQIRHKLIGGVVLAKEALPYFDRVKKIMKLVPATSVIKPVDDAAEVVLPKNCQLEQLAHYVDDSTLVVSEEIWQKLSSTEKAALISHEAIYRFERNYGEKNSRHARKVVAHLFSDYQFEKPLSGLPDVNYSCTASLNNKTTYQFSYYPTAHSKKTLLQFFMVDGKPVVGKMTATANLPLPWRKSDSAGCGNVPGECKLGKLTLANQFDGDRDLNLGIMTQIINENTAITSFYFENSLGRHKLDCFPSNEVMQTKLEIPMGSNTNFIYSNGASCQSYRSAKDGERPQVDIAGPYFEVPQLRITTNPYRDTFISFVKIASENAICEIGGDSLAALHTDWWNDKLAFIPAGKSNFTTDCAIRCSVFEANGKPMKATMKVYGYTQDPSSQDQSGFILTAPLTIHPTTH
ncbi:hypothetical protein [Bdellovibrio sp. HCB274]|uniref:hypothetical protein n=1 Tax=Bdellovibrio sp. HCB274 TaxID=3394361 RepID=UPI0039B4EA97